jgi:two-component sensor histidine kinase
VLEDIYGVRPAIGVTINRGKMASSAEHIEFWNKKYEEAFRGLPQYFDSKVMMSDEKEMWLEIYLNPIYDASGKVAEVSGIGHDITEKKQNEEKIKLSLREKEVLLKEVHHRVKNNLQVISSILNLQTSYVKDKKTLEALMESQNRIKSMAFIHENLYQQKDFSSTNFSEYVVNLSKNLVHTYSSLENRVELKLDVENVFLNLDLAIPCGLIINELVSNSLKYAFPRKKKGEIGIRLKLKEEQVKLTISDNGVGIPEKINYRNTDSLGLQLVVSLVDQLNGTIKLSGQKGTSFAIAFKQHQQKQ